MEVAGKLLSMPNKNDEVISHYDGEEILEKDIEDILVVPQMIPLEENKNNEDKQKKGK